MLLQPLFLLVSSLVCTISDAATQDFHVSFSSIFHSSLLLQSYGSIQALVAYEAEAAVSSAAPMLLFIPVPPTLTSYVLGAYLSASDGEEMGAVLWIANRDRPVSGNFSLFLNQSSGNLVLLDGDGTLAWSSNSSHAVALPVSMELATDFSGSIPIGALFLIDANNDTVWQSSDHPTNTLVPSQSLEPGMSLISWAASSNPSSGRYRLAMEASGLALYFNGSNLPYWAWSYYGHNDSFGVTHTCSYLIRAYMDPLAGGLELQNTTTPAPATLINCTIDNLPRVSEVYFGGIKGGMSSMTFLQLFSNGSMIANTLGSRRWSFVFDLFGDNKCLVPNYCGPYGICTAPSTCTCPALSGDDSFPVTFPLDNRAQGCQPIRALRCSSASKLKLLSLNGVDHVSNKYSSPLTKFFTMGLCHSACLDSCSCLAAFWHSHSNSCFHSSDMSGLENTLNSSYVAFVKVERAPKSNRGLVAGLISGAVLVLLIVAGFATYRKCRAAHSEVTDEDDDSALILASGLQRYKYKELESITNGFSVQMGIGGFGVVYEGVLPEGTEVAVKRLGSHSVQGMKEFRAEVGILGQLHHLNVVDLIGFCAEGSHHRLLVYECMANGSLDKWLFARDKLPPLQWKHRFNIALGAARGLEYLHEQCKDTIVHLDIKPQNILLDEKFVAKIADFGLSRLMGRDETHVITTTRGTPGYLAPEWCGEEFTVSTKCDVFSFGKVLMEVFSGRKNLDTSLQGSDKVYFPAWLYHQITQGKAADLTHIAGAETPEDMRQAKLLMNTAFLCVLEEPAHRPSMKWVVHMLEGHVPQLESLDLSDIFQGLQFALTMPLSGTLTSTRIENALAPIYQTCLSDLGGSFSASGGTLSSMSPLSISREVI